MTTEIKNWNTSAAEMIVAEISNGWGGEQNETKALPVTLGNGRQVKVTLSLAVERDDDIEPPWEHCEGHGSVTGWERRDKYPGERILCEDHGAKRFYDFAEAVRIAKKDGWGEIREGETDGQRAARAVEADYDFLRAWCDDKWFYAVVDIALESEGVSLKESCGGVETWKNYSLQLATELLGNMLEELQDELEEREDAACRDVMTV